MVATYTNVVFFSVTLFQFIRNVMRFFVKILYSPLTAIKSAICRQLFQTSILFFPFFSPFSMSNNNGLGFIWIILSNYSYSHNSLISIFCLFESDIRTKGLKNLHFKLCENILEHSAFGSHLLYFKVIQKEYIRLFEKLFHFFSQQRI